MYGRLTAIVLLAAGAGLLCWTLMALGLGPRHSGTIGLLVLVGLWLNLAGLLKYNLPMRPWLRVLAVLVCCVSLAGVLFVRRDTQVTLATLSAEQMLIRQHLSNAIRGASWIAVAFLYLIVSLLALPKYREQSRTTEREG